MIKNILTLLIFIVNISLSTELIAQSSRQKTKILILGTPHLNQIESFKSQMLDKTISILNKESFDAVCIENMPTELLYDICSRNDVAFKDVLTYFGGERLSTADSVQKQLNISFLEAEQRFREFSNKNSLSDKDHLLMIEYALAIANPVSATLHYTYLKDKTIIKESKLSNKLFDNLINNIDKSNEIYSLALKLAKNRNLNRIEYIDNVQDEALLFKYFPDFIKDYTNNQEMFKGIASLPIFVKGKKILERSIEEKDLLDYYYYLNSEEYMSQDFKAQWEIWLKTNFPSSSDKARYYLWEMRNLQIVANIMKVCSFYSGKKVIIIIGASHKSFIEKYLEQIPSIELLSFE